MNTVILAGTGVEIPEEVMGVTFIVVACLALVVLAFIWGLIEETAEKIRVWRWHRMMRQREREEDAEKRRQP